MNLIGLIFIAVTSALYLGYIVIKYGVQRSISASVHRLENPVKKSLYAWFILCVAFPMMIVSNNWMGVVAGMFLILDFSNPSGGDKTQMFVHTLGANVGMILGVGMLGFMFGLWWLVITTILFVLFAWKLLKNSTWWIEVAVLIAVWLGMFIEKVLLYP